VEESRRSASSAKSASFIEKREFADLDTAALTQEGTALGQRDRLVEGRRR
jgi:hypothetical protein